MAPETLRRATHHDDLGAHARPRPSDPHDGRPPAESIRDLGRCVRRLCRKLGRRDRAAVAVAEDAMLANPNFPDGAPRISPYV
jgi:hypothetical protein